MSDLESISSDDSNDAIFSNDFIESILDDSDSSKNKDNYNMNVSPLMLEYCGHNLNITACHFETSKAFTKPMLKDIEWMYVSGHLKPLAIKCTMLKVKYNRKVYNQDFYKVIYKHQCSNDI
ncbi:unnamed protein product [Rhizophagus irregularis]|nr:unnamed protein product [Rhizophagus irregularis]